MGIAMRCPTLSTALIPLTCCYVGACDSTLGVSVLASSGPVFLLQLLILVLLGSFVGAFGCVALTRPSLAGKSSEEVWNEVAPFFIAGLFASFFVLEFAVAVLIACDLMPDL